MEVLARPAEKGVHMRHHHQGRFGRMLGAVSLTAALSLAAPTGAGAEGRTGSAGVWRWLEGLWGGGIAAVIRDWTPAAPALSPSPATRARDTAGPPPGNPDPKPGPSKSGDQGGGVDPDGRKP